MTRTRAVTSLAALLAVAGLLGACGDPSGTTETSRDDRPASSATGTPADGPYNDADLMFAAGMVPHHAQAVEMSDLVLAKDGVDPAVTELATDIKAAQDPEIEQMRGWLAGWGVDVTGIDDGGVLAGDMPGMDHSAEEMPGMTDEQDMAALAAADGADATRLFLTAMIAHHRGAIQMAQVELQAGVNPSAQALARTIIAAQQAEIATMSALLGR